MKLSTITRAAIRGPHSLKGYFANPSHAVAIGLAPGLSRKVASGQKRTTDGLMRDYRAGLCPCGCGKAPKDYNATRRAQK